MNLHIDGVDQEVVRCPDCYALVLDCDLGEHRKTHDVVATLVEVQRRNEDYAWEQRDRGLI